MVLLDFIDLENLPEIPDCVIGGNDVCVEDEDYDCGPGFLGEDDDEPWYEWICPFVRDCYRDQVRNWQGAFHEKFEHHKIYIENIVYMKGLREYRLTMSRIVLPHELGYVFDLLSDVEYHGTPAEPDVYLQGEVRIKVRDGKTYIYAKGVDDFLNSEN